MKINKMTLLIAAALSLVAATADAESEGAGDPFPFAVPGVIVTLPAYAVDTGSAAYPDLAGRLSQTLTASSETLPSTGTEGPVQTANSLPRGFSVGTVAYTQAQSTARFYAERDGRARHAAQRHGVKLQG